MEYGKHLLLEVITKDGKDLASVAKMKKFFNLIIKKVKFTVVFKPIFYKFKPRKKGEISGITGMCVVSESHISIHTWPECNYFAFDIFSCSEFDENKVIDIISDLFDVKEIYSQIVERGLKINFKSRTKKSA
ncbi:MAG TPA: adenosylmethionine decarboxylase [Candidatus Paceibacterota bacterium]|nr:adenosylmethionine decarboxylase [Candidatus Paceibacterota bacterium]HRZ29626.1 adenosylmethionine decarboxylase [Candidatus Paceibacterota bacterium]